MPDVTDALRELVRALERFPSLFSLSNDAVALYDRGGIIFAGNDVARALVGGRLVGSHFTRHMGSGELERAEARFKFALSGKPAEFESVFTNRAGEAINVAIRLIPALVDKTIVGVFGIARDITLRRRAEAGRDESRQQFRSLFEQHPDSISMVDANGRYERINAAAERMLGYRSEEVVGKKVGTVFPAADRDELDRFVLALTRAGKPSRYERTFARKDESTAVLEGTAVPIVVNERVTGLFLMSRDVTDRAQIEEALALLTRRGRELHRLASEIGADPDEQANKALAFGLKELGFESAFVVTLDEEVLAIERSVGTKLPVDFGDPVFGRLFRETIARSDLLEVDEAALEQRSAQAGGTPAFCRSFIGVPLEVESGRHGALGFASRSATMPLTDFDREILRSLAELTAVSIERANEDKRLQGLAHFDTLTGLPNRLLLSDRFKGAIATAQRRGEHIAVYFIDIDRFKVINDTHGHHVGDEVLRSVARRLLEACRASDTVARLGGDEFIVLRSGSFTGTRSDALAARLRTKLEAPCDIEGLELNISVGIGISVFPKDGKDQRTLLESADLALYAAKACGAGSIRRFGVETSAAALLGGSLERRSMAESPARPA